MNSQYFVQIVPGEKTEHYELEYTIKTPKTPTFSSNNSSNDIIFYVYEVLIFKKIKVAKTLYTTNDHNRLNKELLEPKSLTVYVIVQFKGYELLNIFLSGAHYNANNLAQVSAQVLSDDTQKILEQANIPNNPDYVIVRDYVYKPFANLGQKRKGGSSKYTVSELREKAKRRKIPYYYKLRKTELIDALRR